MACIWYTWFIHVCCIWYTYRWQVAATRLLDTVTTVPTASAATPAIATSLWDWSCRWWVYLLVLLLLVLLWLVLVLALALWLLLVLLLVRIIIIIIIIIMSCFVIEVSPVRPRRVAAAMEPGRKQPCVRLRKTQTLSLSICIYIYI